MTERERDLREGGREEGRERERERDHSQRIYDKTVQTELWEPANKVNRQN